ncbi:hypothetical protein H8356DRAFT_922876 [Neocallimastix lanati (nom. inval.)]|uniref:Uncharacterized protein n=1 Tax=Neocallimastix californiae TaxID=1754190 RepID=A0A1Y2CB22_9FUNG|nr:hypothetical protein H8356DRAFT_922876 [Neocallimastix sp. JGI-2020a]ORY44233.1 hypothetical protein LY90DRAFT_509667 [Neocallimastix californiae]|eukprot:ORY44233.1 hypothetical protein LY90DRAFT_509667 [Neocallimastix californiae]
MRRNINNQRQNFIQNQTQAQHQQQRKIEIINKIETLKYNNKNISILIANLQNLFDKLEKIDTDINDSSKIGILNRCLPENLRWINVFQYSKWNDCCNYVKRSFYFYFISLLIFDYGNFAIADAFAKNKYKVFHIILFNYKLF